MAKAALCNVHFLVFFLGITVLLTIRFITQQRFHLDNTTLNKTVGSNNVYEVQMKLFLNMIASV